MREAPMLARSVDETGGVGDLSTALGRFADDRDAGAGPLFELVDRIAGYDWELIRLRRHLVEFSSAMSAEVELIAAGCWLRVPSSPKRATCR
jgi:hypothetical protein